METIPRGADSIAGGGTPVGSGRAAVSGSAVGRTEPPTEINGPIGSGSREGMTAGIDATGGSRGVMTAGIDATGGSREVMTAGIDATGGSREVMTAGIDATGGSVTPTVKVAIGRPRDADTPRPVGTTVCVRVKVGGTLVPLGRVLQTSRY